MSYSMHKYSFFDFPQENMLVFFDEQRNENLKERAFNIIQNKELGSQERKRECSILLFRVIDRGPQSGYIDVLQYLLEHGADPDIKNGVSMLYLAVTTNNIDAVRLLLEFKADPNTQNSLFKQTPLMQALNLEAFELVELLLNHGADPDIPDVHGKTVLMKVLQFPATFKLAKSRKKILYMLLSHGADVTAKDRNGMTAIDIAKQNGFNDLAEIMGNYPNVCSLKYLCFNYIHQNSNLFVDKLNLLPEDLRKDFAT
jgi:ankyrin repeat protein